MTTRQMHGIQQLQPKQIRCKEQIVIYSRQPMHDEQSEHSPHSGEFRIESSNSSPKSIFNNSSPFNELSAILSFPIPTRSRIPSGLRPSLNCAGRATQPRQEEHRLQSMHFTSSEAAPTVSWRKGRKEKDVRYLGRPKGASR